MALTKITEHVIKDSFKTAISGSDSAEMTLATASIAAITSSVSTINSNMTLATASIAAITSSISRLDTEAETNESNMTLATASIAAITASVATLSGTGAQQGVGTTNAVTFATVDTGQGANELYDMDQNVKTDSDVQFADITSTGTITAVEVHTTFVSSSIAVVSGSNNFGDDTSDHHSFTGSLSISGSGTITGSLTVEGASTIDELTATSLTATGNVSSSITSTGSFGMGHFASTIGVGITNPDVRAGLHIKSADNLAILRMADDDTTAYFNVEGGHVSIGEDTGLSAANVNFKLSGGLVGIGTAAPAAELDVHHATEARFRVRSGSTYGEIAQNSGGTVFTGIKAGGDTGFQISSYGNSVLLGGNVGIGESGPLAPLHILSDPGDTNQPSGSNNQLNDSHTFLYLNGNGGATGEKIGLQIGMHADHSLGGMFGVLDSTGGHTTGDITFDLRSATNDILLTERMRITHEGNVGIGTNDPKGLLNVGGTSSGPSTSGDATGNLIVGKNDYVNLSIGSVDAAPGRVWLQSQAGDSAGTKYALTLNELGGNVGIGQTTPQTDNSTAIFLHIGGSGDASSGLVFEDNESQWEIQNNGHLRIKRGSTDVLELDSGTGMATFSGQYFRVDAGGTDVAISTNTDCMQFISDSNNNGGSVPPFEWWHDHATINSGTKIMHLDTGGDLTITGNITEGSDERLKTDITDIGSCLDKINSLKPITYKWKDDTPIHQNGKDAVEIGFTAQDVEKYFPEVVKVDNDTSYKSLSYARLVTPLIKAVQELSAKVEEQQKEIEELKK